MGARYSRRSRHSWSASRKLTMREARRVSEEWRRRLDGQSFSDKDAPLSEFEKIAAAVPVFRVVKSHPEDRLVGTAV
jgi:hypothetical protein